MSRYAAPKPQFHFGGIANAAPSHVNTICAIGRELQQRGHRFTVFGAVGQARTPCEAISVQHSGDEPVTALRTTENRDHIGILLATVDYMKKMAKFFCQKAPGAFRDVHIDMLLIDQEEPGAATAADIAQIPYVTVCSSVPLNEDPAVPPSFVPWAASTTRSTRAKNFLVYRFRNLAVSGVVRVLNEYRKKAGLFPYRTPDDSFSRIAHFTQLVKEFDFPRSVPPPNFNYVGPFQRCNVKSVAFPYERLDGRPLIYASLGTLQGRRTALLRCIAEGCQGLPVQLVISLGGLEPTVEHHAFPGNPIVVRFSPQRELLAKAVGVVTHGGLNTVMEALSFGVPLVAIPLVGDQWGVAARIKYHQAGISLNAKKLTPNAVRTAIAVLLQDGRLREAAQCIKSAIRRTRGAAQAAEIIESLAHERRG